MAHNSNTTRNRKLAEAYAEAMSTVEQRLEEGHYDEREMERIASGDEEQLWEDAAEIAGLPADLAVEDLTGNGIGGGRALVAGYIIKHWMPAPGFETAHEWVVDVSASEERALQRVEEARADLEQAEGVAEEARREMRRAVADALAVYTTRELAAELGLSHERVARIARSAE